MIICAVMLLGYSQSLKDQRTQTHTSNEKYEFLYDNNGTSNDLEYKKWVINHEAELKIKELTIQKNSEIQKLEK